MLNLAYIPKRVVLRKGVCGPRYKTGFLQVFTRQTKDWQIHVQRQTAIDRLQQSFAANRFKNILPSEAVQITPNSGSIVFLGAHSNIIYKLKCYLLLCVKTVESHFFNSPACGVACLLQFFVGFRTPIKAVRLVGNFKCQLEFSSTLEFCCQNANVTFDTPFFRVRRMAIIVRDVFDSIQLLVNIVPG